MDALAEKIGMDPVELRLKNISTVCQMDGNKPYTSNGLRQCLTEGRARHSGGRRRARGPKRQRPVVARRGRGQRDVGLPGPAALHRHRQVYADGSVNLNMGAADIGTGTKTVMAQVVAEELGVPLDRIRSKWNADTGTTQYTDGAAAAARRVIADSPAVRAAALGGESARCWRWPPEQLKVPAADLELRERRNLWPGGDAARWRSRPVACAASAAGGGGRGQRARPTRLDKVGAPVRHAFRRSGSEHAHRRGPRAAHAGGARQRPRDEPADLSQPGIRRPDHGHRLGA